MRTYRISNFLKKNEMPTRRAVLLASRVRFDDSCSFYLNKQILCYVQKDIGLELDESCT